MTRVNTLSCYIFILCFSSYFSPTAYYLPASPHIDVAIDYIRDHLGGAGFRGGQFQAENLGVFKFENLGVGTFKGDIKIRTTFFREGTVTGF